MEAMTSTEEKIKRAATKVFIQKGYHATKTRDIAQEAGMNIASIHYYYRSKDKLFEIVAGEAIRGFTKEMDEILGGNAPLHEKIREFTIRYIEFIKKNPYIPLFVFSEAQINPGKLQKMMQDEKMLGKLDEQLRDLAERGVIRKISLAQFMSNMMGLTVIPFVAKPLIQRKIGIDQAEFAAMIEERKQMIPDMVISYLYLKKPE